MSVASKPLDNEIDKERNKLRTDKLDITYSELASMYESANQELRIDPNYQRLFRWDLGQQTRFIESILLGFPTPAIFVAETEDGRWELVDGLQRVSTVLKFMGVLKEPNGDPVEPSRLAITEERRRHALLPSLEGVSFEDLSLRSQLTIKRASCRVEVVKVGSSAKTKYEVFERLNTGGSPLTPQEVRNCIFRAQDPEFMEFVDTLATYPPFAEHLNLSDFQENSMYDRGLVLRYLTLRERFENFQHDVEPFITEYVRDIVEGDVEFHYGEERDVFDKTFRLLADALGDDVWRHYRDGKHKGSFSVYVFDALAVGVARNVSRLESLRSSEIAEICLRLKSHSDFQKNTGAGANIKSKMQSRMSLAVRLFAGGTE